MLTRFARSGLVPLVHSIDTLTQSIGKAVSWLIIPLALSMLWEVISRYAFSKPTIWAYEAAYMQMGALFILGIAYVSQVDAHVRVDLLYRNFSERQQALVNLIGLLLIAPLAVWLCFGLWWYFERAYQSGEGSGASIWNPVVWPARLIFWLGFVLFAAQIAADIANAFHTIITRQKIERSS